jgi:hypothetical protein
MSDSDPQEPFYAKLSTPKRTQAAINPRASQGLRMAPQGSEQAQEAGREANVAVRLRKRKYSLLLLDEGVKLAGEIGLQRASEQLGIGWEALRKHAFVRRIENTPQGAAMLMKRKASYTKYPLELKQAVVRKAEEIQRTTKLPMTICYKNAGELLGANGASVRMQFIRGMFSM